MAWTPPEPDAGPEPDRGLDPAVGCGTSGGRTVITREQMQRISGAGRSTLARWYADAERNGHPRPVTRTGRTEWFDEQDWRTWYGGLLEAKKGSTLPTDYAGDPDELVDTAEAARMLNYARPGVIITYLTSNPGYFPEPDDVEQTPAGRLRRRWRRRTIWAFARDRGLRTSPGRPYTD